MSNHHFHRSAGPCTILLLYYFISIRFQTEIFASRVAKPECRTTIFIGRPAIFASRVAKPECRTTIFISWPDRLLFYCFTISFPFGSRSPRGFFASRTAFFACRLTFLHVGQTYPSFAVLETRHRDPAGLGIGCLAPRCCSLASRQPAPESGVNPQEPQAQAMLPIGICICICICVSVSTYLSIYLSVCLHRPI